jgi:hypothetical protein
VSWLGIKQTLWWEAGCRDSLELAGRLNAKDIGREIRNGQSMTMGYARRLLGKPVEPDAYASVIQLRHKIWYRNNDQMILQITFDIADFRILPDGELERTYWLEIENNNPDLRARQVLDRWAIAVSERLGAEPARQAKSELAAEMAGWVPNA